MNVDGCSAPIRESLPEVAAGRASDAERGRALAHVESCDDCADELRVLRALGASRPVLSDALAARIDAGVHEGLAAGLGADPGSVLRPTPRVPRWALAAAAVAAIAVGIPGLMERAGGPDAVAPDEMALAGTYWLSEDPLVAGAPVLETLTDDELERLLEEMER